LTERALHLTLRAMTSSFALTILVLPGSGLLTVASVAEPWRALNRLIPGAVDWRVVSSDGEAVALSNGLRFPVGGRLSPDDAGDLLAVVAGFDVQEQATKPVLAQVRRALPRFVSVAGVESGAWVLGAAGALDGRRATAHWEDLEDFMVYHPDTEVKADRWVVDGRVMTAGGASPAFDLMLHLIRGRWGEAAALDVASVFVYEEARAGSEPQPLVSMGRLEGREPRVAAAVRAMERSLDRTMTMEAVARRAGVSVRRLEMLFRRVLGTSPAAYYARLRLTAARKLVTDTSLPFGEVAERTGFSSLSAFSRAFRRAEGVTAREARAAARAGRRIGPVRKT
jgi:transcriptional regulator GlxA family with amidase domain